MNKNLSQKCIPCTLVSRNNARSIKAILILTPPQDSAPERHSHPSGENFLNLIDKVHQIHCSLHWVPLLPPVGAASAAPTPVTDMCATDSTFGGPLLFDIPLSPRVGSYP